MRSKPTPLNSFLIKTLTKPTVLSLMLAKQQIKSLSLSLSLSLIAFVLSPNHSYTTDAYLNQYQLFLSPINSYISYLQNKVSIIIIVN